MQEELRIGRLEMKKEQVVNQLAALKKMVRGLLLQKSYGDTNADKKIKESRRNVTAQEE